MTLGAGLVLSGCGDDSPATTPAPAPPPPPPPPAPEPEPEPEPEAPGTPTGFHADVTENSITWHWNAVEGAIGYAVQVSTDEMFDATDTITPTVETSFTASDLPPSTTLYGRVAAAAGSLEAPLLSDWTTHVTGMTPAPGAPVPPAAPMGLSVSATGGDYIEWSWEAVDGATGYHIQFSMDESMLMDAEAMAVEGTSYRKTELAEGTAGYLRVRAVVGDLEGMWTAHLTGMTRTSPPMPMNLMATATEDSITWTWDEVDGADGYHIQYSAAGVFTGSSESMDAEGTSYTKDGLAIGTSAFLRVRSTAGAGDEVLTSGWTDPKKSTTMTPQPPAVPTGLAAEGGDGSITWTWDAVEGATGYEVQFSTDPAFADAETMAVEEGRSYTMSELDASTRGYLRVRAVNDAGPSAWAPTVSGTTDAAVVPPPPALEVTFTPPAMDNDKDCMGNAMCPDDVTDKAKATASVNGKMTVMSNAAATITPMFEPDAYGQSLVEGDNMPFDFVTWSTMQSAVVSTGATFKIIREGTTGENAGDVAYVTCGPFRCQSGMEAPGVTLADSPKCTQWDPTLNLNVGLIDNDLQPHGGEGNYLPVTATTEVRVFDGIDLGWTYASNLKFDVTHDIAVVSKIIKNVPDSSSSKSLPMDSVGEVQIGREGTPNLQTYYGISAQADDTTDPETGDSRPTTEVPGACQPLEHTALWDYNDNLASRVSKPDNCFRVTVDGYLERNYLDVYTVVLDPREADVSWGEIDWWKDEQDLKCPARAVRASSEGPAAASPPGEVDVCAMFEEEVDRLPTPDAIPVVSTNAAPSNVETGAAILAGFKLHYEDAADSRHRFTAMWYERKGSDGENEDGRAAALPPVFRYRNR